jgi:drug/metabolite transporter (DMT)-like permease
VEWGVTAAASLSLLSLCEKFLIKSGGLWHYFPVLALSTTVVMWGCVLAQKPHRDQLKLRELLHPDMLQLMVLRGMSGIGFSGALAAGAVLSVANYVAGMSVLFVVVLGVIMLGEKEFLRRKAIAVGVAVVGITAVFAANQM